MKKILQERVIEEAQYFCDKHPDRECFSEIKTMSWYGSQFDLMTVELHLCDECLKNVYSILEKEFGATPKEIEM